MIKPRCTWLAESLWMALALVIAAGAAGGCGGKSEGAKKPAVEEDDEDTGRRRGQGPDIGEDEPDDGLQVEGLRGRIETYDIQQGVEPHAQAIDDCFTQNRGKRRLLGGQVELAFLIGAEGAVQSVHMSQSNLGAWPVERCLLVLAQTMTFVKPKGGPTAEFTLPLNFSSRTPPDEWDQARAGAEVTTQEATLAECGEAGSAPASASITLYIGTRGQVQSVGFSSTAPIEEAWATCAEQKVLGWTLSDPKGRIVRMTFPFPAP
ncbi:MAG TPA: AgmX/PglI C-terminal domain-containing protein [Haliangium sp.]|nr:AgmX/PglI C-terminal domain-containing protein [Haliangium sp.]